MHKQTDIALTALAPIIWGSTYYVTTEFLPESNPITLAMLRALPAGILLMVFVRQFPNGVIWWLRMFILGALNFTIFWVLLFFAAYRLPGGVAATIGAIQPLIVIFFANLFLDNKIHTHSILAAIMGVFGVSLLAFNSNSSLDPIGMFAGVGSAVSMAIGSVLTRKWHPPTPLLTFTAWQLTTGGLLLIPFFLWAEPSLPTFNTSNIAGLIWLGLFGAAFSYFVWFRGITKVDLSIVSMLGFLSPVSAITIGWLLLEQGLTSLQLVGVLVVLTSVWLSQKHIHKPNIATVKISKHHTSNLKGESL